MPRGLEHIVHAVRDLEAAAELYERLGFSVGARNRHPWGTHNRIVQFPGFFVELLTVAEPEKLGDDGLSVLFGAYNRDFLDRREGLSVMVVESTDVQADETEFLAAGILALPTITFEREGRRPDGTAVKVAFSLIFAQNKAAPDIRFAACRQHYPENFWSPAFQSHANGAVGLAGVVAVAERPEHQMHFWTAFTGGSPALTDYGFAIATPRGRIEVLTPSGFLQQFGTTPPDARRGARLAAIQFHVNELERLRAVFNQARIHVTHAENRAVIASDNAMGAVLIFANQ
ncbi:MAG TPA: VOC family protein [Pseudolabrys sp.]|nr:VOC family protein [Pseudolabrys sp.]